MMLKIILSRFLFKVSASFNRKWLKELQRSLGVLSLSECPVQHLGQPREHEHEHGFPPVIDATVRPTAVINTDTFIRVYFKIHISKHPELFSYISILRSFISYNRLLYAGPHTRGKN